MDAPRTTPQPLPQEAAPATHTWSRLKMHLNQARRIIFEVTVVILLIAVLGSLNQLYKAIITLTEFNANAITKPQIYQGAAPNAPSASTPEKSSHKK